MWIDLESEAGICIGKWIDGMGPMSDFWPSNLQRVSFVEPSIERLLADVGI